MLGTLFLAVVIGLLVALVGMIFDKSPDNRYAWAAGGVGALFIVLSRLFNIGL
jgi:uncharacterized membrane protein YdcZ (DUF606 family)